MELGFPVRVALLSLVARLVVAIVVACSLGALLRALLMLRVRRLEGAHWTERARALWPLRGTMTATLALIGAIGGGYVSIGYAPIAALGLPLSVLLTFLAIGIPLWRLRVSFEIAVGALPLSTRPFRELVGVLLIFGPALLLLAAIPFVPVDTPTDFWTAIASSTVYLAVVGHGAGAELARLFGILKPARESVVKAVRQAAAAMHCPTPPVFELRWNRANAAALPNQGWLFFTSRAVEVLESAELEATAAHELGHLAEPRHVRALRGFGALLWLPLIVAGLSVKRGGSPQYFVAGLLGTLLLAAVYRVFYRRLEHRADVSAHNVASEVYASALEKLHRTSLVPAVLRSSSHPSLYDRMVAAGKSPDYPRPEPPALSPGAWTVLFVPAALLLNIQAFVWSANLWPPQREMSDEVLYIAAAIRGWDAGERMVVRRLRQRGRIADAIAFVNAAAASDQDDARFLRLAGLERETGDCPSATRTLMLVKDASARERAIQMTNRVCAKRVAPEGD
jgi:Zn-dependent protease with chaperone function